MKKLSFLIALTALISLNSHVPGMAEPNDKPQQPANMEAGQAMTPAEKYNLLGKQTPSSDKPMEPGYGANPADAPNMELTKEKHGSK